MKMQATPKNVRSIFTGLSTSARKFFAGADISVEGILLKGDFFGGPGFGKRPTTDPIERVFFLQLQIPLSIQVKSAWALARFKTEARTTSFIQLSLTARARGTCDSICGEKVRVTGEPLIPIGLSHRAPVILAVQSICQLAKWDWEHETSRPSLRR
jgi:hypothetical protein